MELTKILGLSKKPFTVGITGYELLKPVVGFYIVGDGKHLTTIENVSVAAAPSTEYRCSQRSFVFLLMDGEVVTRVVYSVPNGLLTGIRHAIVAVVWKANAAFEYVAGWDNWDFFVHSFCCQPEHDRCVLKADKALIGSHFRSVTSKVGGVLVKLGDGIVVSIDVLSDLEYARFVSLLDQVSLPANKIVVEILRDEEIINFQLSCTGDTIQTVRFQTTRRTTPWIGSVNPESSNSRTESFRCGLDEFICGVFASPIDSIGFGVVTRDRVKVSPPTPPRLSASTTVAILEPVRAAHQRGLGDLLRRILQWIGALG